MSDLTAALRDSFYEPAKPYRWNGIMTVPIKIKPEPARIVKRPPPPKPNTTSTSTAISTTIPDTLTYYDTVLDNEHHEEPSQDHWYDDDNDHRAATHSEPILSGTADIFTIFSDDEDI